MPTTFWTEAEVEQHSRDLAELARAAAVKVNRLTIALRGGNADRDNADMLEWLAERLVNVHGESEKFDYIRAAKERASMIRAALKDTN